MSGSTAALLGGRARSRASRLRREVISPEEQWLLRATRRGQAIHELIAALLEEARVPTPAMIRAAVAEHSLLEGLPVTNRQAVKQHLTTAVALYFRRFLPCGLWDFVGHNIRVEQTEFDLLWQDSRDGNLLADELKTSIHGIVFGASQLEARLVRQVDAGEVAWGPRFRGIRAIVLADPARSFFVDTRSSGRSTLQWELL